MTLTAALSEPIASNVDAAAEVFALAYSPNGRLFASAHADATVRIRATESGNVLATITVHDDVVSALTFAADSQMLATASFDGSVKVWRIPKQLSPENGIPVEIDLAGYEFANHDNWVMAVDFSPLKISTGHPVLVSAGYDRKVRFWDLQDGKPIGEISGHKASIRALEFTPTGNMLVTAGSDRLARAWAVGSPILAGLSRSRNRSPSLRDTRKRSARFRFPVMATC